MKATKNKRYKAFSIVEMLVTMAIFAILSVMLLNSLLLNIKLSTKINLRARVRSDMNEVVTQIERDIRNAEAIEPTTCIDQSCVLSVNGATCTWSQTGTNSFITRTGCGSDPLVSNPLLYVIPGSLDFNVTSAAENDLSEFRYVNVVVTFQAESDVDEVGCESTTTGVCTNNTTSTNAWVEDQVRQFSVSTRNYLID